MSERYLIIDDDDLFRSTLVRAFKRRKLEVQESSSIASATETIHHYAPSRAIIDMKLTDGLGIELIEPLLALDAAPSIIFLTGFATVDTAVHAMKLGATNYLTKPANLADILSAFEDSSPTAIKHTSPTTLSEIEWEHIQQTLRSCEGNISRAAKQLGIHRRSLQRKLQAHERT